MVDIRFFIAESNIRQAKALNRLFSQLKPSYQEGVEGKLESAYPNASTDSISEKYGLTGKQKEELVRVFGRVEKAYAIVNFLNGKYHAVLRKDGTPYFRRRIALHKEIFGDTNQPPRNFYAVPEGHTISFRYTGDDTDSMIASHFGGRISIDTAEESIDDVLDDNILSIRYDGRILPSFSGLVYHLNETRLKALDQSGQAQFFAGVGFPSVLEASEEHEQKHIIDMYLDKKTNASTRRLFRELSAVLTNPRSYALLENSIEARQNDLKEKIMRAKAYRRTLADQGAPHDLLVMAENELDAAKETYAYARQCVDYAMKDMKGITSGRLLSFIIATTDDSKLLSTMKNIRAYVDHLKADK